MRYIKWILLGAASGAVLALLMVLIPDLRGKAAALAGIGAGFAGLARWALSLLKVTVDLQDQKSGQLIKVIDLPGEVGKFLVVGVYLAGARLYLGYVEFR